MQQAIYKFRIKSRPLTCKAFGNGNINYTF